jgi:hypothetical protein
MGGGGEGNREIGRKGGRKEGKLRVTMELFLLQKLSSIMRRLYYQTV